MKIETKYNIGDRVWVVYENKGEVCVYDDIILYIAIEAEVLYVTKEGTVEICEDEIILYEESDKLVTKIKEVMAEIREKEGEQNKGYKI